MKIKFYKQKTANNFNWATPPEIDTFYEPRVGDRHQLSRHGKLWEIVDVAWCFEKGNKFSHFRAEVV